MMPSMLVLNKIAFLNINEWWKAKFYNNNV